MTRSPSLAPVTSVLAALAAPAARAQSAAPALPDTTASLMQMAGGLLIVLLALFGVLMLLRRIGTVRSPLGGKLRVLGGVAVGPRERVVLVEVADTWLVLGVAPGQVEALHTLPRQDGLPGNEKQATTPTDAPSFSALLRKVTRDRSGSPQ